MVLSLNSQHGLYGVYAAISFYIKKCYSKIKHGEVVTTFLQGIEKYFPYTVVTLAFHFLDNKVHTISLVSIPKFTNVFAL